MDDAAQIRRASRPQHERSLVFLIFTKDGPPLPSTARATVHGMGAYLGIAVPTSRLLLTFAESYVLPNPQLPEDYVMTDSLTDRDIICNESPDCRIGESSFDPCHKLLRIWCGELSIVSRYSISCAQIPPRSQRCMQAFIRILMLDS